MQYQNEPNKKSPRKVITIVTVIVVIILFLIVILVVASTRKLAKNIVSGETTTFESSENTTSTENRSQKTNSEIGQITTEPTSTSISTEANIVNNIPATGPENLLPLLLLSGTLATFISSSYIAKKRSA